MTQPVAVIFGAGNIGRGFLGQLFHESGLEVVFVDVDTLLIDTLNQRRGYTIQMVENDSQAEMWISPVRAYAASQQADVARALAQAQIAATAVGVRALAAIAPLLAEGVRLRAEAGSPALNIVVCENLKDAAHHLRALVAARLQPEANDYFQSRVGFVETVIGRMVPPPTPEMRAADPGLILVEPYKELPVDRSGVVGTVPQIVGMELCDNFVAYTARKLYLHNCGHAVLAYLGYRYGHTYGYDALADERIFPCLERAMREAQAGIVKVYGASSTWLDQHRADLLRRFANRALGDTIFRLGRDPLRKLAPEDRLVGAARLAEQAGILPDMLAWGVAAALCFDPQEDPLAQELQTRISAQGIETVLMEVCRVNADEMLGRLVLERFDWLKQGKMPEIDRPEN
ncbi:MAG TPA: hypothetical protein VIO61_07565 [Anaerolineaceae bacterium]